MQPEQCWDIEPIENVHLTVFRRSFEFLVCVIKKKNLAVAT